MGGVHPHQCDIDIRTVGIVAQYGVKREDLDVVDVGDLVSEKAHPDQCVCQLFGNEIGGGNSHFSSFAFRDLKITLYYRRL